MMENSEGVQVVFCLVFYSLVKCYGPLHTHNTRDFGLVPNCVRADKNAICNVAYSVDRELKFPKLSFFSVIKTDLKEIRWTKVILVFI